MWRGMHGDAGGSSRRAAAIFPRPNLCQPEVGAERGGWLEWVHFFFGFKDANKC